MNYFETNLEEISRSIQLLAQIFEYQVFELQVEEKDENQTAPAPVAFAIVSIGLSAAKKLSPLLSA